MAAPGTPQSVATTSGSAWQVEPKVDLIHETFADKVREALAQVKKEYGGPENYLRLRFQTRQDYVEWLEYLVGLAPTNYNNFCFSQDMPASPMDQRQAGILAAAKLSLLLL